MLQKNLGYIGLITWKKSDLTEDPLGLTLKRGKIRILIGIIIQMYRT